MRTVSMLLSLFISAPIWFYLLHSILVSVHASELQMFLFWAYVPVSIIVRLIGDALEAKK